MALETGTYISDLVATNPTASDPKAQGDDHIRLLKSTVKVTFPNVSGAVTPTHVELNYVDGVTSAIQTQFDAKAPKASPTFTGTVILPATGSGAMEAATKTYADSLAFSAALPSQTGNADKLPTTDGTTASWTASLKATVLRWVDGTDTTKKLAFVLSGLTTATTRSVTWPDKDGTVAMTSDIPAGPGDNSVVVTNGNGHGSTANKIRRWTTTESSVGSAIVYADSAANGSTFTIQTGNDGLYAITYTDGCSSTSTLFGISINSADLTTGVQSISAATRLGITTGSTNNGPVALTVIVKLAAGDVIRPHTDGAPDLTGATSKFSIRKINS